MTDIVPRPTVRFANRALSTLWRQGFAPPPVLTAKALMEDAQRVSGLTEFNEPGLAARLERLTEALHKEAGLTALGRTLSYGGIRRALVQRLRCEAMLAADPRIKRRPVAAPIIIVGSMRSGTTRLQRLLAADPRFVSTRLFEAMNPAPDRSDRHRILATRSLQWASDRLNPAIRTIHPGDPRDSDEELGILELALSGAQIEAQRPIPSWARWMERTPQRGAYRWLKRWMQLTGERRGDDPAKPWVLKTPQYMQDLPELLQVFPDARLIFIHRAPRQIVASAASLAWNYMQLQSDSVTPEWCGAEWLHKTAWRVESMQAFRRAHPQVPAIDVRFEDMNDDWTREIGRIYDWLGLDPTAGPGRTSGLENMRAYMARAQTRHLATPHRYSLAEFGIQSAQVDERLGSYAEDFDLSR
ncbi:sulfotransferase family protein [Pacificimonas sp. ICDLI1SI03]